MKRLWTQDELVEHWTLSPEELTLLGNKAGTTRLGFALLLKAFQLEGRWLGSKTEAPGSVVAFVARQVNVSATAYLEYDWRGRAIKYHRAEIRAFLGVREATLADAEAVASWLIDHVLPHAHRLDHLRAVAHDRFRALRLEPSTASQLNRLVRSALHTYETQLFATTLARLTPEMLAQLDALIATRPHEPNGATALEGAEGPAVSAFASLRADPGAIGLESVQEETAKLTTIRTIGLPADLFRGVAPAVLEKYRQRAAAEWPRELRAHAPALRATLLAAFCVLRSQEITDSLVDLLIQIVHRIGVRAERRVEKELLEDFKRVAGKHGILYRMAEASLDRPDEPVRAVIYPVVDEQTLRDLVKEYKSSGPAYRVRVHTIMRTTYRAHYRRMLPLILGALTFRSNNERHQPVVRAVDLLIQYADSKARRYAEDNDGPLDGVVPSGMLDLVVDADAGYINRINYEIAVLHALREGVRCKEIWVEGANRYRNPDDDLPQDFDAHRAAYYAALQLPTEADQFIADLKQALTTALTTLNADLPTNPPVTIMAKGRIKVTPLSAQPEPPTLDRLKDELLHRWPMPTRTRRRAWLTHCERRCPAQSSPRPWSASRSGSPPRWCRNGSAAARPPVPRRRPRWPSRAADRPPPASVCDRPRSAPPAIRRPSVTFSRLVSS